MSKTLQTLTTIAIVLLGVASAVQAQNLTVKITKTDGSTAIVTAAASLQAAIGSTPLNEVTQLKISAGRFNSADWSWLRTNRSSLDALTHFTITNNITSVADMPNNYSSPFFGKSLQEVNVAKLGKIGSNAFANCTSLITASFPQATTIELQAFFSCNSLTTTSFLKVTTIGYSALCSCSSLTNVSLPRVTSIGSCAFGHCILLTNIFLGATPPGLSSNSFNEGPTARYLILVDAAGNRLTGSTLTNARNAYKAIADGNTSDNFWQGWNFGQTMYKIESTSMNNGIVWVSCNYSPAGAAVTVNPQPDTGYMLSSLTYTYSGKTPIPITDGSFTMPAANVTINAVFEVNTLNVLVNGDTNKQAISLEEALSGIELGSITSLTVTAGSFNTTDWLWLKNNRNSLTSLTSFTITDDITTVADIPDTGPEAPYFNSSVQAVNVAKVSSIGNYVFFGCSGLTTVGFPQVNKIGVCAFADCSSLTTTNCPQATSIGVCAFADCSSLTTTNFPQATSIGEYAFSYCTTLTTANFPQVTTIGTSAFRNCIALASANFPQVNAIGDYAFLNCTFLATASFTKITSIWLSAFSNCSHLTNLKLNATPPTVSGNNPFIGCPVTRYLILTDAAGNQLTGSALTKARNAYKAVPDGNTSDDYWQGWDFGQTLYQITLAPMSNGTVSGYSDYLVEGASVTLIPQPNTGYTLSGLSYSPDGGTPTPITNNTFEMPAANVTITATFKVNALSVTINGTTVKQETCLEEALYGVEPGSIKSLTVTAGSFSAADWQWLKSNRTSLTSLTSFTITDGVAYVANIPSTASGSPYFNSNIQKLKVANVFFIGNYAFSDCTSLTSADFPKVTSIGTYSFYRCASLTTAGFPSVAGIGNYAFSGCTSLTMAGFPLVASIEEEAFFGCTSLTNLVLNATPPTIFSNMVFANCPPTRNLILVDEAGNQLTGTALIDARNAYKAVIDYDLSDNYWYGWTIENNIACYRVSIAADILNGVVSTSANSILPQGSTVTITAMPNHGYKLKTGSLKAYKTGDKSMVVTITNGILTMPAYNATITAEFERDGPTSVETQAVVSLGLYPNPCRDQVYIKGLVDYAQVEVYAHTGSKVLSVQLSPSQPLNLQSLQPGIYLVKVNGVTLKLLKNK